MEGFVLAERLLKITHGYQQQVYGVSLGLGTWLRCNSTSNATRAISSGRQGAVPTTRMSSWTPRAQLRVVVFLVGGEGYTTSWARPQPGRCISSTIMLQAVHVTPEGRIGTFDAEEAAEACDTVLSWEQIGEGRPSNPTATTDFKNELLFVVEPPFRWVMEHLSFPTLSVVRCLPWSWSG